MRSRVTPKHFERRNQVHRYLARALTGSILATSRPKSDTADRFVTGNGGVVVAATNCDSATTGSTWHDEYVTSATHTTTTMYPVRPDSTHQILSYAPWYRDMVMGIIAGVVTASLLWGLSALWTKVLVPWFEARVYSGLDLEGSWVLVNPRDVHDEAEFEDEELLSIEQSATRLSGTLTFTGPDGAAAARVHQLSGTIRDRLVCMTSSAKNRKSVGYTLLLAEVAPDGKQMKGHAVYYDLKTAATGSSAVTYERKS